MNILARLRDKFLTLFGDIKIYPSPMFVLYDPGSYLLKGDEVRELIGIVQPGDILVRGFVRYLDGYFIPGYFSHVGLYLGKVPRPGVPETPQADVDKSFREGEQIVIHAMAEGVFMEDILSFSRCDFLVVLRPKPNFFSPELFEFPGVYEIALQNLGKPYDFGFNFLVHDTLCCTEFVFECYEKYLTRLGVLIKMRKLLFLRKSTLVPDDFITDKFEIVWTNRAVDRDKIARIIAKNKMDIDRAAQAV